MTVFIVIAVFAVVQSVFGVGLLVFGTPTLLLTGHSFADTLATLLPASLAVSLLQVWTGPEIDWAFVRRFSLWCLAPLAVMLALAISLHLRTSLNLLVAAALAVFVVLRVVPALREGAHRFVVRHETSWLLVTGIVHGLSNLGGGLLTILAASRHAGKERVRHLVAVCYTCFAAIQLAVLALLAPEVFGWRQLAYAATSAAVFLGAGQHVFRWVSAPVFDRLFTAVMAAYATLLVWRTIAG